MISLVDRSYQQSVTTLEKIREEWQKEHIKACEVNALKRLHVAVWSSGCPSPCCGEQGQRRFAFSVFLWQVWPRLAHAWLLDSMSHYFEVSTLFKFFFLPPPFKIDRVSALSSDIFAHYLPAHLVWPSF